MNIYIYNSQYYINGPPEDRHTQKPGDRHRALHSRDIIPNIKQPNVRDNVGVTLACSDEHALATAGRFDGESPREIGEVPVRTGKGARVGGIGGGVKATRFNGGRERVSSGGVKATRCSRCKGGQGDGAEEGSRRFRLSGGAEVGADKIKVTEGSVGRKGGIAEDEGSSEAWNASQVASTDSTSEGGDRGRTKRAVMVSNEGGVGEVVNVGDYVEGGVAGWAW
jgi:hypothetical protein